MIDPFAPAPLDDPEYEWAQWAATKMLLECRRDWQRLAQDDTLDAEVRVRAAHYARALRGEMEPC